MKRTILLAVFFVLAWTGMAMADVCVLIQANTHWMDELSPSTINAWDNDCKTNGNCAQWYEYEARWQKWDIMDVYDGTMCPDDPATCQPVSERVWGKKAIKLTGNITLQDAQKYQGAWVDFTGENDADGNPITYTKRQRKFSVADDLLPQNVKNQLDGVNCAEYSWDAIRTYVEDKLTGIVGQ